MMQFDGDRMGRQLMSFSKAYRRTESKYAGGLRGAALSFEGDLVLKFWGTPCARAVISTFIGGQCEYNKTQQ
jgi:hypothetical protein